MVVLSSSGSIRRPRTGLAAVVEAADQAAGWLPGFASGLHRDELLAATVYFPFVTTENCTL